MGGQRELPLQSHFSKQIRTLFRQHLDFDPNPRESLHSPGTRPSGNQLWRQPFQPLSNQCTREEYEPLTSFPWPVPGSISLWRALANNDPSRHGTQAGKQGRLPDTCSPPLKPSSRPEGGVAAPGYRLRHTRDLPPPEDSDSPWAVSKSFNPPEGVLCTFPSRYLCAIRVSFEYLALEGSYLPFSLHF